MTMRCTVCRSDRLAEIDAALRSGMSLAAVSRMTGMPFDPIKRHRASGHVPPGAAPVPQGAPGAAASTGAASAVASPVIDAPVTSPREELAALKQALDKMLATASPSMSVAIIAERRRVIEAQYRVVGPPPADNISYRDLDGVEEVEASIFAALEEHDRTCHAGDGPERMARKALADAVAGTTKEEE